eukprot:6180631-Pleurochrysis_carterae.AAC.1
MKSREGEISSDSMTIANGKGETPDASAPCAVPSLARTPAASASLALPPPAHRSHAPPRYPALLHARILQPPPRLLYATLSPECSCCAFARAVARRAPRRLRLGT